MKAKFLPIIVTAVTLFSIPKADFGQAPNLGTAANFVLFSTAGAVGNTGISQLTGNVGTNVGAITGFGNVDGVMHNADAATAQAVIDLQAAWYYLDTLTPTATHGPVLGNGETLFAGVDTLAAAGSVVGTLTLDAQGNPNAVFIIKTGGALTTAASATVTLINGAVACNVFWVAEGAISMATLTVMRGTLISHNGAIDMGAGGLLEGRELSTTGAVSVYGTTAYTPIGCGSPTLTGPAAPILGSVACFALFSANGVVSNSGTTNVTGDVGTNQDSTIGYNPLSVIGTVHKTPDATTAECATDLQNVYTYLNTLPYDIELLYPAQFGNKLTLTPHTYRMNAAVAFNDTLYLNAEGNADAIFVIQIIGALSTSTYSKVALINGAQAKNIYWEVQGAVTISDNSIFCGTIVSHNAAIILNSGVLLQGRALTTAGALTTASVTADNSFGGGCSIILPANLTSFTGVCNVQSIELKWTTTEEANNAYFTVQHSADGKSWDPIGTVVDNGSSSIQRSYSFVDKGTGQLISSYRLMLTRSDGHETYSTVISVSKCGRDAPKNLTLYPNPTTGRISILFAGDKDQVRSIEIFNALGQKVYESIGMRSDFDLYNQSAGVYFVQLHLNSKTIVQKIILQK